MRTLILVWLLYLCAGYVFAQEPDWVKGKSREYQEEFYLTGVGSGDTRQDAEGRARAHIAEVFSVNIKSDISLSKTETITEKQGKTSAESREVTRSKIDMGLKKTLEGTEIVEVWQDPKDATYYALAVLDREKAGLKMTERIRELDNEAVRLKGVADTTAGKIKKLKVMLLRRSLMADRISLDSDLRIVSSAGKGIEPPYSVEKENTAITSFLQNEFVVGIIASGPGSDVISQTATDLFTSRGFTVSREAGKRVDLLITITSSTDPSAEPAGGWYYCRWHLEVNAADASTGDVMMSLSENGKSGQLSAEEAGRRAVYDMNRKTSALAGRLVNELSGTE